MLDTWGEFGIHPVLKLLLLTLQVCYSVFLIVQPFEKEVLTPVYSNRPSHRIDTEMGGCWEKPFKNYPKTSNQQTLPYNFIVGSLAPLLYLIWVWQGTEKPVLVTANEHKPLFSAIT